MYERETSANDAFGDSLERRALKNHVTTTTLSSAGTEDITEEARKMTRDVTYRDMSLYVSTRNRDQGRAANRPAVFHSENETRSRDGPFVRHARSYAAIMRRSLAISRGRSSNARDNLTRDCRQLISRVRICRHRYGRDNFVNRENTVLAGQNGLEFIVRPETRGAS